MRIAVLGSWRREATSDEWSLLHQEYFKVACRALGEALAANGHELVIAQAVEGTADKYVAEGFDRAPVVGKRTTITTVHDTPTWGAAHIIAVQLADAVVVIGGTDGSYSAGLATLLARKQLIPIGCFGGAARNLVRRLPPTIPQAIERTLSELDPTSTSGWEVKLTKAVIDLLEVYPRILIIHGRRNDRYAVKRIISDARTEFPNLPEAVIISEHGLVATAIHEQFEDLAAQVDAAIAVVTPDDLGITAVNSQGQQISAIDLREIHPRARENVWVEVGWFWGRLGRDRLMILKQGDRVKIPSDLAAVIRHSYTSDPSERASEIRHFIRTLRTGMKVQPP